MEESTFFIKPEGIEFSNLIITRFAGWGLTVVQTRRVVLTTEMLAELYPRYVASPEHQLYWQAILKKLRGREVLAGIVSGQSAIPRLLALCGAHTKPASCAPGTIRHEFAAKARPVPCGALNYWPNVIHRAENAEEVARDKRVLWNSVSLHDLV